MIDIFNLDPSGGDYWALEGQCGATNPTWKSWQKPRGKSWLYLFMTGGGGGGGGGQTNTAGTSRGGGGSGSGACFATLLIPLALLPDTLYIQPGSGGLGGTAAGNGNAGGQSYVSIRPAASNWETVLTASGGNAGSGSVSSSGGGAGSAPSANNIGSCSMGLGGVANFGPGGAGVAGSTAGGTGASPADRLWGSATNFCIGGGSGAATGTDNADFVGAAGNGTSPSITINNSGFIAQVLGGPAGGGNGGDGICGLRPLFAIGGGGGGTAGASGTAGRGGHGRWGSGGGGGGGGVTGGAGGNGGNGVVLMFVL